MRQSLKSPASPLFTQSFIQTQIKENIKAPRHWPLCGEFTGDRWILRTNGQQCGKSFHLMTSSYVSMSCNIHDILWWTLADQYSSYVFLTSNELIKLATGFIIKCEGISPGNCIEYCLNRLALKCPENWKTRTKTQMSSFKRSMQTHHRKFKSTVKPLIQAAPNLKT